MLKLEVYIVSINDDNMMRRHIKLGVFDSYEKIEHHVNEMDVNYTLEQHGDLFLCIAYLTEENNGNDIICTNHGHAPSLKLEFFPLVR